ncbi:related to cytochrome p450 [Phialocephala subalpina]|uniref:Related to cytochrome p450 n=1 Tax=Phialocephala subalpina TaxID=576137 RepID=A0A1L7X8G0_9HELO|nr:related to cytochrome p450 [Phialocephala subalpina]
MPSAILFSLAAVLAILLIRYVTSRPSCPPGTAPPPGPKGLPILGSMLDIPPHHSWLKFFTWSKTFGPLFEINIAGKPHIILSTEKIANDLLRERGSLYSSREQLPMAVQLVSDNLRSLFLPYDSLWRRNRKLMHHLTMASAATSYQSVQEEESLRVLRDLMREPGEYERWFERYAAGLMMRLVFGKKVITGKERVLERIFKVVHNVERVASPGAYLVDVLPWLMWIPSWFPGAGFKREGYRLHAEELDLFRGLQNDVRKEIAGREKEGVDGGEKGNFTEIFLNSQEKWDLSDDEGAYVVGTLFEAGAGTTSAAMMSFMLAMVLHPSALHAMREEINKVVGPDRLPTFDDIPNLPRVRATIKETMRWRPVTAGGVPHLLIKDDVYELDEKKYFLKAGTNIHANQWAIHREPDLYPNPEDFIPERWLDPSLPTYKEPLSVYPNLQNFSAFGFGRRICPGMNIAERSLNILVARIVWGCEIERVGGYEYGEYEYTTGFNVQPLKFPFRLRAREGMGEVVEREYGRVWSKVLGEKMRE